ncbi:SfnB family sulfur acquisition oxidoreductase [Aquirhabdus parva]|uniref:SfnB family sulfur acquisition oxidoreductase n=1 Tax=Aquirhabdus parva TaxID=2283318 RepID=UPI003898E6B3
MAPRLLKTRIITTDQEALDAAQKVAEFAKLDAQQNDQNRVLPWKAVEKFTTLGLGGIRIPKQYGGARVSHKTLADVFRIISKADPSVGQIPQNQISLLNGIEIMGTEEQKRLIFAGILHGKRLSNGGPERNTKTSLLIDTQLEQHGDHYTVTGKKFYSTGALFAHWVAIKAMNATGEVVLTIIERGTHGLQIIDDWNGFGQRTTASGTVVLDHTPVIEELIFNEQLLGQIPSIRGAFSQLIQVAIDVGIAEAALEDTIGFIRTRARPWMDAQVDQASLEPYLIAEVGRLKLKLNAAISVLDDAASLLDAFDLLDTVTETQAAEASIAVAEAKVLANNICLLASEKLFELSGSRATLAEFNLDRHWRNARVHTLHDPVRWKIHAIGDYYLNNHLPARHVWI